MSRAWKLSLIHLGLLVLSLAIIAAISPAIDNPKMLMSNLTHITFNDIIIAIILAVSLNLILGMTGQFSLGHAGFMAVGAYVAAVLGSKPEFMLPQLTFWTNLGLSVSHALACMAVTSMVAAMIGASI